MTTSATFLHSDRLKQAAHWGILGSFGYLLMIPVGHTPVLMVALLVLAASSAFLIAAGRRSLARELWVPAILSVAVILLGVVVGIGNEGWAHSLIAWVAAPVLFWMWAAALTEELIRKLLWVAVWVTIALSAITLLIAFTIPTGFPASVLHPIFGGNSRGFAFGATIAIYGTSTLMATAPMWIVGALLPRKSVLPDRRWIIAAAVSALVATVVSSRRATVVLAILIPIIILIAYWLTRDRSRRVTISTRTRWFIAGSAAVLIAAAIGASFTVVVRRTVLGVVGLATGKAQTLDERLRFEQLPRLWDEFLASPIWGQGIGMTIDGYTRHPTRAWVFEMQYNLLLAHIGILGAVMLIATVVLILRALWRAAKARPDLRPVFAVVSAAALSILVGNALNPILQAPGHFWSVFLLIACINVALLSKRQAD
ncbi:hypothetical protein [Microbacterium sp. 2RAF4]|uniref:hypothetical protein n=1 Tax=Microbacterium sp. 2RAF4 TaxID=3232999 RepID=UPI003F96ADAA